MKGKALIVIFSAVFSFIIIFLLCYFERTSEPSISEPSYNEPVYPYRYVIVRFKPDISEKQIKEFAEKYSLSKKYNTDRGFTVFKIRGKNIASQVVRQAENDPLIEYVKPYDIHHPVHVLGG